MNPLSVTDAVPNDLDKALLVGRVWLDGPQAGPTLVTVHDGQVIDITEFGPTMADLLERDDLLEVVTRAEGQSLGSLETLLANSQASPAQAPYLLAPCDVQAVKACGVTFAVSLMERVIEEQAGGDPTRADELRDDLQALIGSDLSKIKPGSEEAMALKKALQARGGWSQYMEVGIGPDAEVFTKAQPLSSVGFGTPVGLHPSSQWNNPEPEIVLAVDSRGQVRGATLGNDVNLRDVEGRSALLLGKAKDNNASCSIGPFIRLFDDHFDIDSVRNCQVSLRIEGEDDDFLLQGESDMREISRDPLDLVSQTIGAHHQYPDGFMLFLGTMFSPIQDRDGKGQGFTHHMNDRVTIATPALGALVNKVGRSDQLPPWTYGIRELMRHLARR
ncbi:MULTISPECIES: fumarylacetoacetate hydrolase family protein [unclassified Halomonas]|uniref:fumarylacetoacetate hydrolase family protein n=1 Tax=unclassified Halomonas TaxID=2609666 RepID=UPI0007D933AB|nr:MULTISPECIES: fumarylacetoacetate hydrolase family protein [unclassified Halomonas]MBT2786074.1 fumarylacetoacetate hydrolase family protein [Halomonas sp. ISL-106]MBT2797096.1 fumarylacetoacetate hydrolase family protein [Halomonas sp. ISL-104]OAL58479.1 fumarylacetoacetate hydrolase [Halomonas sp. ALS9]